MSDLRPKGYPLMVAGVERHLLFTLNAIDEIQDQLDCSLEDAINKLTDKRESAKTMKCVLSVLLTDEAERTPGLTGYTPEEIGREIHQGVWQDAVIAVLRAYGLSLPEADEYEHPNG